MSAHTPKWFGFAVVVLSIQACAPLIAHGPDVHPGFSGGASAALGSGPRYEGGDDPGPFYFGTLAASAAYGFRSPKDSRPALRLGIQTPTDADAYAGVDLYLQAPRKWISPVAAGVGLLAEFPNGRLMPYLQTGVTSSSGFGFNVAVGRYADKASRASYTVWENALVNWLTVEAPVGALMSLHFHGGFASGHVKKQYSFDTTPYVDEDRWVMLGGVTLEIHR
ncbi:MAG TPA: hypothetical protein VF836_07430 [Gemmatimonadaceae bacterium]